MKKKNIPAPWPTRLYQLTSMVRNIFIGHLGPADGNALSQLLHTCSLAEYGRLENVLNFIAATGNISIINILLVLNPKHRRYWEGN